MKKSGDNIAWKRHFIVRSEASVRSQPSYFHRVITCEAAHARS